MAIFLAAKKSAETCVPRLNIYLPEVDGGVLNVY